jgi:hypothetical protein
MTQGTLNLTCLTRCLLEVIHGVWNVKDDAIGYMFSINSSLNSRCPNNNVKIWVRINEVKCFVVVGIRADTMEHVACASNKDSCTSLKYNLRGIHR